MNPPVPTVFVIDDDESVRRALARLLRAAGRLVETFASAREFLDRPNLQLSSGCLLLDLQMPKLSGLDLQAELNARGICIPIVFLTGHGDVPSAVHALKGGAVDFLTKPYRAQELLAAVTKALEKDLLQRVSSAEREQVETRFASLTSREREVLALVVAGFLNKQIAAELGNSERTVKVHRARVMRKMKVESVAELTRIVERNSLKLPAPPLSNVGVNTSPPLP